MTPYAGFYRLGFTPWERYFAAAKATAGPLETYLVADVTALPHDIGKFDLVLDVGCLQGLAPDQRLAYGREVTRVANPDATMLSLQFGTSPYRRLVGGISHEELHRALPCWRSLATQPAQTCGLGWPMSKTRPTWHRLRLAAA